MRRLLKNWPLLVFTLVPLSIAAVSASVLIAEQQQADSAKAIRLVRESASRKENFTVQQYLYSTIYHRRDRGEAIEIRGWDAKQELNNDPIRVQFTYVAEGKEETAEWLVNLPAEMISPANGSARELSWH